MRNKKIIQFICIVLCMIMISACKQEKPIEEKPYSFTLDENKKTDYLSQIELTNQTTITYQLESDAFNEIVSYHFEDGASSKKIIYRFYASIDAFRSAVLNHNDLLDGKFLVVDESILCIKTSYETIESVAYEDLYEKIKQKYTIITSKEELVS